MESGTNDIHAASDGAQDKKVRVQVLGRGTRSKRTLQSPNTLTSPKTYLRNHTG